MQRSDKKMQISFKKSSRVVCPQILFFWHWNRAMNSQVWETELVTSYWCKYFNFFPKWIHSPLEPGLALMKKLFPKIWVISQHELHFLWKKGRGKNHTSPNKKRAHGLKLWVNSKHLIFWEGLGKCRTIPLSEGHTSATLCAQNPSWPKHEQVKGLQSTVVVLMMPKTFIETPENSKHRTHQLYLSWRKTEVSKLFFPPILVAVPSQVNNSITLLFETCKQDHFGGLVILFFFTKLFFTGLLRHWNRIHIQSNWSAFLGMTFQSQRDVQSFNVTSYNRAVWIIP